MDLKIDIYTKPGCKGCDKIKNELHNSDLEEIVEYKTIQGREGKPNLDFIKSKGIQYIPAIHIYSLNGEIDKILEGSVTIETIKQEIKKTKRSGGC